MDGFSLLLFLISFFCVTYSVVCVFTCDEFFWATCLDIIFGSNFCQLHESGRTGKYFSLSCTVFYHWIEFEVTLLQSLCQGLSPLVFFGSFLTISFQITVCLLNRSNIGRMDTSSYQKVTKKRLCQNYVCALSYHSFYNIKCSLNFIDLYLLFVCTLSPAYNKFIDLFINTIKFKIIFFIMEI